MLEERRRAFEAKYEHDQQQAFRIRAHRDRLFGLWVAAKLGYRDDSADAYAMRFVTELGPKHDLHIRARALEDLQRAHIPCTPAAIRAAFEAAEQKAGAEMSDALP
jgi:hypothetical protein